MLVAVMGGNLQGIEATYLAKQAGWEVLVVDQNPQAGASLMCDRFLQQTITSEADLDQLPQQVELVIPALEDTDVLGILTDWSSYAGIPMAFDLEAYAISASKQKSNQVFKELNLNLPTPWPDCDFPIVLKPDGGSGSRGVQIIHNQEELMSSFPTEQSFDGMVAQAYLEGPSYSLEVIGSPGNYHALQITELQMDRTHDCKRVLAPAGLDSAHAVEFQHMAISVAEHIQLRGLMDMEVILHNGQLMVLEIDARLPSQTPTAVYHSQGINMVELLGKLCLRAPSPERGHDEKEMFARSLRRSPDLSGRLRQSQPVRLEAGACFLGGEIVINRINQPRATIYEHIKVAGDHIEVMGEHVMSDAGPLKLFPGLFGADEVISNFRPDLDAWVATLILRGKDMQEVLGKREQAYDKIRNRTRQTA